MRKFHLTLREYQYYFLEEQAQKTERSMSAIIRIALDEFIHKYHFDREYHAEFQFIKTAETDRTESS